MKWETPEMILIRCIDEPRFGGKQLDALEFRPAQLVLDALQIPPVANHVAVEPLDRQMNQVRCLDFARNAPRVDDVATVDPDLGFLGDFERRQSRFSTLEYRPRWRHSLFLHAASPFSR